MFRVNHVTYRQIEKMTDTDTLFGYLNCFHKTQLDFHYVNLRYVFLRNRYG